MEPTEIVTALGALAHETRLAAFRLLVQAGSAGLNPGFIAEQLQIAPSPLSFHLKELTRAKLIGARPEGRKIHYTANFETMNALVGYLTENCCGGVPCATDADAAACC
jgi:DNA-binding transcriptional ArsR family regulator